MVLSGTIASPSRYVEVILLLLENLSLFGHRAFTVSDQVSKNFLRDL